MTLRRREGPVTPRYPRLRQYLVELCANRAEVEPGLARTPLHPVEEALVRWGLSCAQEALRGYPAKPPAVQRDLARYEETLRGLTVRDDLQTLYILFVDLREWSYDPRRRDLRIVSIGYGVGPDGVTHDYMDRREAVTVIPVRRRGWGRELMRAAAHILGRE